MSSSDKFAYEKSLLNGASSFSFKNKQFAYVPDTNNGGYSPGTGITFDLSSFSNSDKFVDMSQGFVTFPVIALMTAANLGQNDYAMAFKNGYYNLIDSWSCKSGDVQIHQQQQKHNIYVSFKKMTEMSRAELETVGPSIGFYPDNPDSSIWSSGEPNASTPVAGFPNPLGNGLCNNMIFPVHPITNSLSTVAGLYTDGNAGINQPFTTQPVPPNMVYTSHIDAAAGEGDISTGNDGLYRRVLYNNQNKAGGSPLSGTQGTLLSSRTVFLKTMNQRKQDLVDSASLDLEMSNYVVNGTSYTALYALAQIRLCDISDFFKKVPLVKRMYSTLTFFLNTGNFTLSIDQKGGDDDAALSTVLLNGASNTFNSLTCPIMVTSMSRYRGGLNPHTSSGVITKDIIVSVNVVKTYNSAQNTILGGNALSHPMTSCRITVPLITMTASQEIAYLEKNRPSGAPKLLKYTDVFCAQRMGVVRGENFQHLISNGLSGVKRIIAIPFISAASNGLVTGVTTGFSTIASPFCESPGCGGDYIPLTNVQVQVGGSNVIEMSSSYQYENFLEHLLLSSSSALNGNHPVSYGLVSGLMSQQQWNSHRVYAFDLSRHDEEETYVNKSIIFSARNSSKVTIDVYFFVETTKGVLVDVQTGIVTAA